MGAGSGGWGGYGACNLAYLVPPGPLGVTRTLNRVRLGKKNTLTIYQNLNQIVDQRIRNASGARRMNGSRVPAQPPVLSCLCKSPPFSGAGYYAKYHVARTGCCKVTRSNVGRGREAGSKISARRTYPRGWTGGLLGVPDDMSLCTLGATPGVGHEIATVPPHPLNP